MRVRSVLAIITAGSALGCLWWIDPALGFPYPPCLFSVWTGFACPGCGALRAIHHLLHGHFTEAFRNNALLPVLLLGWLGVIGLRRFRLRLPRAATIYGPWLVAAAVIAFGVLRNIPAAPFRSLTPPP
jgi:hypothetical protein